MDFIPLEIQCLGLISLAVLLLLAILIYRSDKYPVVHRDFTEKTFYDPKSETSYAFPSLSGPPSVSLSVVVPAYNEEERLPPMLDECLKYLEERCKTENKFSYEVIVANDGSSDGTAVIVMTYSKRYGTDKVRLLDLQKNRGKGGAVRLGVESSRGSCILFADADGATKFSDLDKLYTSLNEMIAEHDIDKFSGIVCGSRAHMEDEAIATRSFFRTILMHGFHLLVYIFTVKSIRDTQCGFKLFTRTAARTCFSNLHIERWAFDVELLYIAEKLKIPVAEVAVKWTEIDGSKVTPILSWLQMGRDLVMIWLKYKIGAWLIRKKTD